MTPEKDTQEVILSKDEKEELLKRIVANIKRKEAEAKAKAKAEAEEAETEDDPVMSSLTPKEKEKAEDLILATAWPVHATPIGGLGKITSFAGTPIVELPVCPKCGSDATVKETKYGPRYECCDLYSWQARPLVSAKTHSARKKSHQIIANLCERHSLTKTDLYDAIKKITGHTGEELFLRDLNEEEAAIALEFLQELKKIKEAA